MKKKTYGKKLHFYHPWHLEANALTLRHIWWEKRRSVSWAIICFFIFGAAIIVLEIVVGIPDNNHHFFAKIWPLLTSAELNIYLREKWPKWLRTGSLRAFDGRIARSSSFPSFRVEGDHFDPPPPPWRRWLRPPPGRRSRGLSPCPQRSRILTSLYPGFSASGWFRRAARQSPGTVCRPHTPSSSPPQRPRLARPTGSRTPKLRDSWRQDAGTGLGRRSAAGRAPPPASRGGVTAGGGHYVVRWSGHHGARRAEDNVQGRAAPRRRPARPRLASGGPARHHRRRLLFASQQTIIHAQRRAGRQAVSGQRNSSACMLMDGYR